MSKLSTYTRLLTTFLAGSVVLIVLYVPFHALFSVSLGAVFGHPLIFKAWKDAFLGVIALVALGLLLGDRTKRQIFFRSRLHWLFFAYIGFLMVLAVAIRTQSLKSELAGLIIDGRFAVFFLVVRTAVLFRPKLPRYMIKAFVASSALVISFGLLQQYVLPADVLSHIGYSKATISPYLTVDNNPLYIRINSTLRGPNPLGAYIVMLLSFLGAWIISRWGNISKKYWLIAGLAIVASLSVLLATYSRSAGIGLIVAVVTLGLLSLPRKLQTWSLVAVFVLVLGFGAGYELFKGSSFVRTVIDHKDPSNPSLVDSNLGHIDSVVQSTGRVLSQPFGGGIGSTGSASLLGASPLIVENQYLFTAHEAGWIGAALYIAIIVAVQRELYRRRQDWRARAVFASGIGLIVIGLLLPVFTDDTLVYLWWGLAAALLPLIPSKRTSRNDRE